jgi:type I restriction enzyme S subunit
MSFPRYPRYKDSNVFWLGEVPEHWGIWRLSHAFDKIGSGTTPRSENREFYEDGDVPWINTGDLTDGPVRDCEKRITSLALKEHSSLKIYPAGSIVVAMYGATTGKLGVITFAACVNQACCVFAESCVVYPKYLFYSLLAFRPHLLALAVGGGQPNISQEVLRAVPIACPDLTEQSEITSYLDRETEKIDALIGEQQRLVEFLREKRRAAISQAVTKGLNAVAPLKPSGVKWLGDIPRHWQIKKLAHLVKPSTAITYGIVQAGPDIEGGIPYIRTSDMAGDCLPENGYLRTSDEIDASYSRSKVNAGDLVIAIRATVGKTLPVPDFLDGANLTQGTARFAPGPEVDHGYMLFFLNSVGQVWFESIAKGATFKEITLEMLRKTRICLPPVVEQREISSFLGDVVRRIDGLISEAGHAVDLLQERRSALISAAVTGKIDVRNVVPECVA